MAFNYYYGSQAEQFSFVRIPRIMLTDKAFQTLSITSKVLYGVLLDRMSLSMKNNWFDEENRVSGKTLTMTVWSSRIRMTGS